MSPILTELSRGITLFEVEIPTQDERDRRWWRNAIELGSRAALSSLWSDHGSGRLNYEYQVDQIWSHTR